MKRLSKKQMRIFAVGQLGWSTLSGIISAWFVTFYLPTQADISENGAIQYITPGLDRRLSDRTGSDNRSVACI